MRFQSRNSRVLTGPLAPHLESKVQVCAVGLRSPSSSCPLSAELIPKKRSYVRYPGLNTRHEEATHREGASVFPGVYNRCGK
jgi:hypothetical protein